MLLVSGRFAVSQTIIPEAQEHFLTPSAHRDTHIFGGLGLTQMADSVHTNRSRFLEQLILLAEPIFSWETPPPRPWWKFWGRVPQPPELVAPAHNRQIMG